MINIEKLVADYLRDALEVRVVAKTPDHRDERWVKLTMIGAPSDPVSSVDHLVEYFVQLDSYAGGEGGQPEAMETAIAVRGALHAMPDQGFDDAVVSSVRFSSMNRLPDVAFEPARERVVLDALIHAHPVNGGS